MYPMYKELLTYPGTYIYISLSLKRLLIFILKPLQNINFKKNYQNIFLQTSLFIFIMEWKWKPIPTKCKLGIVLYKTRQLSRLKIATACVVLVHLFTPQLTRFDSRRLYTAPQLTPENVLRMVQFIRVLLYFKV